MNNTNFFIILAVLIIGIAASEMAMAQGKKKSTSKIPVKTEKPAAKRTLQPKQEKKRNADEPPRKVVERKPQSDPTPVKSGLDNDNVMFGIDDVTKTVQAGNYKVYLLKDGRVVSYNRATGKMSMIHGGGAKDIGFYDAANGIISIRNTDDTRKQVKLDSD